MIIIFGGSFDPMHEGHLKMMTIAFKEFKPEKLVVLPAMRTKFKKAMGATSYHRINMIRLAIDTCYYKDRIAIEEYETQQNKLHDIYTYDTICALKEKASYKNQELAFLIGSDQLQSLNQWHRVASLAKLVKFICVIRPGYPIIQEVVDKYQIAVCKEESIDVSSSNIRIGKASKNQKINDYIFNHCLYLVDRVRPYMSETRYRHALNVARLATKYAGKTGLKKEAFNAGLLHDITKSSPINLQKKLISNFYPNRLDVQPAFFHQYSGAALARIDFNASPMVQKAIRQHTSGSLKMGMLDKILYAADKTCLGREKRLQSLVPLLCADFDEGFKRLMKVLFIMYGDKDDPITVQMYNQFM